MGNKPAIHRTGRDRAVADLLALEADGFPLDGALFQLAAETCGYSVRQLKRTLTAQRARDSLTLDPAGANRDTQELHTSAWEVSTEVVNEVFICCGNLQNAYTRLTRQGTHLPSLSTFKRKVKTHIGEYGMQVARKGERDARQRRVYLKRTPEERGHTYETDHTEAPIWVTPTGHKQMRRPYLTSVIDRSTGYVITFGSPTSEEVRAAFISAIHTRTAPDGNTLVGGLPTRLVWDQGKEYLSELVTVSCLRLGTEPCPLPPYSPHLKGQCERFWRTIKENLIATLPGYIDAGADVRGNLTRAGHALSEVGFVQAVTEWVDWYNTEHVNRATGSTALDQWRADPRDIVQIPDDQLWQDFLLFDDRPKVSTSGVRFLTIDYVTLGGELDHLVGRRVQVRYLPHQRDFIEIFHDGKYVATGYPSDKLTPEDRDQFLRQRQADAARARKSVTAVKRLHKNDPATSKINKTTRGGRTVYEVDVDDLRTGQQDALDSYRPTSSDNYLFDSHGQGLLLP